MNSLKQIYVQIRRVRCFRGSRGFHQFALDASRELTAEFAEENAKKKTPR